VKTPADDLLEKYSDITPDNGLCIDFLSLAGPTEIRNLDYLGLILITPETFILGRVDQLLRRFDLDGLIPIDCAVIDTLSEDQVSYMFIPNWIPERFRWWLFSNRFKLGPTAAILVTHLGDMNIHTKLAKTKGFRIPMKASEGTWRRDFGAINGVLNLVHTADNPAYVLRNGGPFFSTERFVNASSRAGKIRSGDSSDLDWNDTWVYGLAGFNNRNSLNLSFLGTYLNVLQRILHIQWQDTKKAVLEMLFCQWK